MRLLTALDWTKFRGVYTVISALQFSHQLRCRTAYVTDSLFVCLFCYTKTFKILGLESSVVHFLCGIFLINGIYWRSLDEGRGHTSNSVSTSTVCKWLAVKTDFWIDPLLLHGMLNFALTLLRWKKYWHGTEELATVIICMLSILFLAVIEVSWLFFQQYRSWRGSCWLYITSNSDLSYMFHVYWKLFHNGNWN